MYPEQVANYFQKKDRQTGLAQRCKPTIFVNVLRALQCHILFFNHASLIATKMEGFANISSDNVQLNVRNNLNVENNLAKFTGKKTVKIYCFDSFFSKQIQIRCFFTEAFYHSFLNLLSTPSYYLQSSINKSMNMHKRVWIYNIYNI